MDGSAGVRTFRAPESQRLDAFVDAAFAFAVSLLIIAGAEPLQSFADLARALARIPAFACGFALIALFWLAHRNWARLTPIRTGWTTFLSLAVVFAVLVFVFPLRLLTETATHHISGGSLPGSGLMATLGDLRWTYVIYGLAFAALAGLTALLFAQAHRALAGGEPDARRSARQWELTWLVGVGVGLISAVLALTPLLGAAPWLPGVIYNLIPLGVGLIMWRTRPKPAAA
ncbi:TMEM175 family protein [Brevundimonas sp. GCM10030266]|uniref:TMEM175 family protein n=1 Tax=Brevundimonas sp. GCM10030266 TaxID=3273386 RepID=UPI00361AC330